VNRGRTQPTQIALIVTFGLFLAYSWLTGLDTGQRIGRTFASTSLAMVKLLPCAFILIALFDTWIKRETVERHFGEGSGVRGYVWGLLLAGTSVGGLYVAFPLAHSLHRKGAKLTAVFAYIGFVGVSRIPWTMFEASFMGLTFTLVRLAVSIPLVILASVVMGRVLSKRGYQIQE